MRTSRKTNKVYEETQLAEEIIIKIKTLSKIFTYFIKN